MFSQDKSIKGCPSLFSDNCRNYEIQCHCCKANKEVKGDDFYYDGFSNDKEIQLTNHPYIKEIKQGYKKTKQQDKIDRNTDKAKLARKYNRKGKQIEQQVVKSIQGAKSTYLSGAHVGDGDFYLLLKDRKLRGEHKCRFNNKNWLSPTKSEFAKGEAQKIDLYIITSEEHGSIVTMKLETLEKILGESCE